MNDFREFQKQYNDYLQHGLPYADDYICHFGILGMKWGVRRYQNPDGTLTPAGKSRYDKLNAKASEQKNPKAKFKLQAKAAKYGTQTPKEKAETQKKVEEFQKKKIEETEKIDLEKIRNNFVDDETKDKWSHAVENDEFDMDFLEITQNDYDDYPEEARKKQQLKDYSDYLNSQRVSKIVIDKDINSKELDEAADLGLKAFNKLHPDFNDAKPGDKGSRYWFNYEDQTIGYTEVADLCKKMNNKNDVLNTLKSIDNNKFNKYFNSNSNSEGLWDLDWFVGSEITGDYAQKHGKPGEKYIDAIFAILQAEGKIQHSAVEEIFKKFSII